MNGLLLPRLSWNSAKGNGANHPPLLSDCNFLPLLVVLIYCHQVPTFFGRFPKAVGAEVTVLLPAWPALVAPATLLFSIREGRQEAALLTGSQ